MERKFTPENITKLNDNEIFVFGSNMKGDHAGGAARIALEKFGAVMGQAEGPQGQSYAIPTLDENMNKVTPEQLQASLERLAEYARVNSSTTFYLTKIGCGIAGFTEEEMIGIIADIKFPSNVTVPIEFAFFRKTISGYKGFNESMKCRDKQYAVGDVAVEEMIGIIADIKFPSNVTVPIEFAFFRKTISGYKGFNESMKCRDKQYAVGDVAVEECVNLCYSGLHFCVNPHDVFSYYPAGEHNRFCQVEADEVSTQNDGDSKRAAKRLKVEAEISVFQICRIAVSAFFDNFGFRKRIESSSTANAGNFGAANAGDRGAAIVSNGGKVKGGYGCVLVARNIEWTGERYEVTDWAAGIVDGEKIKADTWYRLKDGKLVEVCEQ